MQAVDIVKEGIASMIGKNIKKKQNKAESTENDMSSKNEHEAELQEGTLPDGEQHDDAGSPDIHASNTDEAAEELASDETLSLGEDDPIELLKRQHREVELLFKQLEEAGDRAVAKKEKLAIKLGEKLQMHMMLEEKIFYPAVRATSKEAVIEAFEEHDAAKMVLAKLLRTEGGSESFDPKAKVLKELINHHVKEEEEDLFVEVRAKLSEDQLADIGERMMDMMERGAPRRAAPARAAATRKTSSRTKKTGTSRRKASARGSGTQKSGKSKSKSRSSSTGARKAQNKKAGRRKSSR